MAYTLTNIPPHTDKFTKKQKNKNNSARPRILATREAKSKGQQVQSQFGPLSETHFQMQCREGAFLAHLRPWFHTWYQTGASTSETKGKDLRSQGVKAGHLVSGILPSLCWGFRWQCQQHLCLHTVSWEAVYTLKAGGGPRLCHTEGGDTEQRTWVAPFFVFLKCVKTHL